MTSQEPDSSPRQDFPSGLLEREGGFPSGGRLLGYVFLAKKFWNLMLVPIRLLLKGPKVSHIQEISSETGKNGKRGRPTAIDDAMLVGHAEEFNWLLGSAWPDIGWQLEHVREPEDITAALEPLRGWSHRGSLNPFLRTTEQKATAAELRRSHEVLGEAVQRESDAGKRQRTLLERSQLSEMASSQANPQQREGVEPEAKKRRAELDQAEKALGEANREVRLLEEKLRDQEAYFCRAELFKFIHSGKYACNPRNLAFAMAGLPDISCFWSLWRCQKLIPKLTELEGYRLVEFFRRIWERRESSGEQAIVDLFATAIRALSKDNHLRMRLGENWRDLKGAIRTGMQEGQKQKIHPKRVPYIIASNFYKNVSRPKTAMDRLLDEQERLNLDSEDSSQPGSQGL